ncbi:elongation factor Ts [Alkalithermobacter thermoalcaliphilus JW-YL-7 = DSM 7308]|uniref:Elongation factor Ts n=1 Tax=Alkalithermobacter thermoalcaliphilus JW-YL-7 = DSM 7308 TaxID=1121328 RepID=A0A150FRZ0_CLOPD|nr:Elongation factor Ts [[Clostridium] paradoxum JW-YL-7 = DSM 7308]SHK60032.1 elongation factor Ts [[Clostridium] paradoxum JW-YL-7 = DSM 7308]
MAITAAMVKELREKTGAGMMDCKKALEEAGGDLNRAVDILREKGLAKAAKKSDRIAAEGLVSIAISNDNKVAAITEINSETDFVAKNDEFKSFVQDVTQIVLNSQAQDVEQLLEEKYLDTDSTVKEVLNSKIATIGENMNIRRFEKFEINDGQVAGYVHGGGKIGVLVKLETSSESQEVISLGKDIAMQVAAMNPKYISQKDVDQEYIAHEKEILMQQALNEGKPADIVEKMVMGRLNKQLKEVCLLDQSFVKNPDITVGQLVKEYENKLGVSINISDVVRFEVGEGIEKKEENFAEEVAKQLKN